MLKNITLLPLNPACLFCKQENAFVFKSSAIQISNGWPKLLLNTYLLDNY